MKVQDIVNQLRILLPKYTDKMSTVLPVSSTTATSTVATITTSSSHGLTTGQAVTLANIAINTPISGVAKNGLLYTFSTSTAHDLTQGWAEHETVTFSGFTDSTWNASFTLMSVPNRNTFVVQSANVQPTLNGNEVLEEIRSDGINGQYSATVVSKTVFTISGDFLAGTYVGGTVNSGVRVAGAVTLERAIEQYTEQNVTDLWFIVVPNDAEVSKDRHSFSDATATRGTGDDIRVRLIDGFTINIFVNTSTDMTGTDAIDLARHTLLQPILKSVYGAKFDTGLAEDADFRTVPTSHGIADYNKAYLIYTHAFEFVMELTIDDSVTEGDTRAFRDINYTQEVGGDDTTDMTVIPINLDVEP